MKTLVKIQQVREKIKESKLQKKGYNSYSEYYYYTPEQISYLIFEACKEIKLFNKFDLIRTDLGLMALLYVYDLEDAEAKPIEFKIATEIPAIKATNAAQQLGGAVTYSERYLLMIAYDIKDNTLDFDSQDNRPKDKEEKKEDNRPWMDQKVLTNALGKIRDRKDVTLQDGTIIVFKDFLPYLIKTFRMKNDYRKQLEAELNDETNKKLANE